MFTAGHCGSGAYKHNGWSIGSTAVNAFYNGSTADAQINIPNSLESNLMYTTAVMTYRVYLDPSVGTTLYKSGISTGVTGGPVEDAT